MCNCGEILIPCGGEWPAVTRTLNPAAFAAANDPAKTRASPVSPSFTYIHDTGIRVDVAALDSIGDRPYSRRVYESGAGSASKEIYLSPARLDKTPSLC
jgi:hypothetical protein